MKKKYKIVNKTRFYLFIISLFAIISVVIISLFATSKAHSSIYQVDYKEIEIVKGDTLWNIALNNLPANTDVRKMVYELTEFNNLKNGLIYPGDKIKVPIAKIID